MQIKTIRKIIEKKINEWIETITDVDLKKNLKNNVLVTGGCITSMLLNLKVNDFDIYIKDYDILLNLIKYYTKNTLPSSFKGHDIILDGRKKDYYDEYLKNREDFNLDEKDNAAYSVALRTLKSDQIKIFTLYGGTKVNTSKEEKDLNYDPIFISPNAISLFNNIQIVIRFWGDSNEIHKSFDYIHATNYWTNKEGLVTNVAALESILTMQLRYNGSLYPVTSIIRMKKFLKRNWNISAGEILKILFQVSQLNLSDPDVLEEQLIGVDVAYFGKLIEVLRSVDKEIIDSHYLNTIIDRVFNDYEETNEQEEKH